MNNLVVLHPRCALNLLGILLRLLILRQQFLHVVDNVLELLDLGLTRLKLLVSLHKLSLDVVVVVLRKSSLILGVLQLGVGVVEGVGLVVTGMVSTHQLVGQLLLAHLEDVVLLE
jgi:hypothetical protein